MLTKMKEGEEYVHSMQKENADSNIVSQEKKNVFSGSSKYNVDEKLDIKKKKCVGVRSYRANGFHFLS